jgi:hypothetical protein
MRDFALGSMRPHSVSKVALDIGVVEFTAKSTGIDTSDDPSVIGASIVTLGSWPRKAERRNLKPADETNVSVQARTAVF